MHHLTNLERTVTELVSQNTELYVDLCEMGDMARERSRKREAVIGIDLAGGVDYTVDTLIRHKWPDEKPKEDKEYLVLYKFTFFNKTFDKMIYHSGEWEVVDGGIHFDVDDEDILYWWELPEVKE